MKFGENWNTQIVKLKYLYLTILQKQNVRYECTKIHEYLTKMIIENIITKTIFTNVKKPAKKRATTKFGRHGFGFVENFAITNFLSEILDIIMIHITYRNVEHSGRKFVLGKSLCWKIGQGLGSSLSLN